MEETVQDVLDFLANARHAGVRTLDLMGGAPEINDLRGVRSRVRTPACRALARKSSTSWTVFFVWAGGNMTVELSCCRRFVLY